MQHKNYNTLCLVFGIAFLKIKIISEDTNPKTKIMQVYSDH
jgi:hypothetical protein